MSANWWEAASLAPAPAPTANWWGEAPSVEGPSKGPSTRGSAKGRPHPDTPYLEKYGRNVRQSFSGPGAPLSQAIPGALEALGTLATGAIAPVFGGLDVAASRAGIGGPADPQADYAAARDKYVYQPRTQAGQQLVGQLGVLAQPLGDAITAGGSFLGRGAGALGASEQTQQDIAQMAPDLLTSALDVAGLRAARGATRSKIPAAKPSAEGLPPPPAQTPAQIARAADIPVAPSDFGTGNLGGRIIESLAGPNNVRYRLGQKGLQRAEALVREEVGVPKGTRLTASTYKAADAPHAAVYDEVRKTVPVFERTPELDKTLGSLGGSRRDNPFLTETPAVSKLRERARAGDVRVNTADAMDAISEWRAAARVLYKTVDSPEKINRARIYRAAADALENAIGTAAERGGSPELLGRFKAARQARAKINEFRDATDEFDRFDPQLYAQRTKDAPLTGRSKLIRDLASSEVGGSLPPPSAGAPSPREAITAFGARRNTVRNVITSPLSRLLASDFYQNQLGRPSELAPGQPLGAYFDDASPTFPPRGAAPSGPTGTGMAPGDLPPPGPAVSARLADRMAGDLDLVPEGPTPDFPPAPPALTADVPPPVTGDVPFTPSRSPLADQMAGEASLAPDVPTGALPGGQAPRAPGMAQAVEGTTLFPELRAVRSGRDVVGEPELSLVDDIGLGPMGSSPGRAPPAGGLPEGPLGPGPLPPGRNRITLSRGTPEGVGTTDTSQTLGNALMAYGPEDQALAGRYGNVGQFEADVTDFVNAESLPEMLQLLGLSADADVPAIVAALKQRGAPGGSFRTPAEDLDRPVGPREYIYFPPGE